MSDNVYLVPEEQLYRLILTQPRNKRFNKVVMYQVPEEHLFELMESCAKKNKCKTYGQEHCKCHSAALDYVVYGDAPNAIDEVA